ncbi:hypothetical protein [Pseudoxanthomonas sp. Soil82]|uniref:hypothetical protein n=1 Tax=Pseudoxanthomonas sp. Soil82 TaxID=3157341 RepID=UPI00338FDCA3
MPSRQILIVDDEGDEFEATESWQEINTTSLDSATRSAISGIPDYQMRGQRLNPQRDGSFVGVLDGKRYRLKAA